MFSVNDIELVKVVTLEHFVKSFQLEVAAENGGQSEWRYVQRLIDESLEDVGHRHFVHY